MTKPNTCPSVNFLFSQDFPLLLTLTKTDALPTSLEQQPLIYEVLFRSHVIRQSPFCVIFLNQVLDYSCRLKAYFCQLSKVSAKVT
jgi:hypothetical protein